MPLSEDQVLFLQSNGVPPERIAQMVQQAGGIIPGGGRQPGAEGTPRAGQTSAGREFLDEFTAASTVPDGGDADQGGGASGATGQQRAIDAAVAEFKKGTGGRFPTADAFIAELGRILGGGLEDARAVFNDLARSGVIQVTGLTPGLEAQPPVAGDTGAIEGNVPPPPPPPDSDVNRTLLQEQGRGDVLRRAGNQFFPGAEGTFLGNRVLPSLTRQFEQTAPITEFFENTGQGDFSNEALVNRFQNFLGGSAPTGTALGSQLRNILNQVGSGQVDPDVFNEFFSRPGAETQFGTIQPAFQAGVAPLLQGINPGLRAGVSNRLEQRLRNDIASDPENFLTPQQIFDRFQRFIPQAGASPQLSPRTF